MRNTAFFILCVLIALVISLLYQNPVKADDIPAWGKVFFIIIPLVIIFLRLNKIPKDNE